MARLALLVGIGVTTLGSYYSCSSNGTITAGSGDSGAQGGATFASTLTLRDSTGARTSDFTFGEPLRMNFEIRNLTQRTVHVDFDDARTYDFLVLGQSANTVRWRWSDGQSFAQVRTELTFGPLASKSFEIVWNGILGDGTQLPAGSYRARAALIFPGFDADPASPGEMASPMETFTVH